MKSKGVVLTLAEKSKNILASNWQGQLNTIKADAQGSKNEIHSSKVKYLFKRGKPYIWIPEDDMHNTNTVIDERGSLSVTSPYPGPLASLLRSIKKLPTRVVLIGDIVPLEDLKVNLLAESVREKIATEQKTIREASYSVSGILSSSTTNACHTVKTLRRYWTEGIRMWHISLISGRKLTYPLAHHVAVSLEPLSANWSPTCSFVDGIGVDHELDLDEIAAAEADLLSPYTANLVDGINQSQARRRALMLFCLVYLNVNAKVALMLSLDHRGFNVLGKALKVTSKDGSQESVWREYRFTFKEEARDIETFCRLLVEMEEEALKKVKSFSGLGI